MKTFASGAKSSEVAPRLDLIPPASLKRQADRMALGAESHGERNYEKGATDPTFVQDRKNHLAWHVARYLAGDASDDHLGAILANAGMLCRLEEIVSESVTIVPELITRISHDERHLHSKPCPKCQTDTYPPGVCVGCRRKR